MPGPVCTGTFPLPPADRREILRYAGVKEETPELTALLEECLLEAEPLLTGRVCWAEFPLRRQEDLLDLGFAATRSASLTRNLSGCEKVILFGATLGLPLDRLITRQGRISPARGLMLQAIGTERIEALCDVFCNHIRSQQQAMGLETAPRFSPGYGDLPLQLQADIFRVLDCSRRIGLTLNESFLMSPSKSVTAIIGAGPCPGTCGRRGCADCGKSDCIYRRTP